MSVYLNIEINILVIFVLCVVLSKVRSNVDKQMTNVLFSHVLYATLAISGLDTIFFALSLFCSISSYVILSKIVLALRFSVSGFLSYAWCMYILFDSELLNHSFFDKSAKLLAAVPVLILCGLSIASPWTGWIFKIDGRTGAYTHGEHYTIQVVITYLYFFVASLSSLIFLITGKNRRNRSDIFTQFCVIFLPLTAGVIHLLEPSISLVWPTIAVLLFLKFVNFQEQQIFLDGLTGLNNRRSFDKYLDSSLNDHFGRKIILYMIDVDHFKSINDSYGHTEGDAALVQTAEILRTACSGKNAFLARYGGDEFAIVYQETVREDAEQFNQHIIQAFENYNKYNMTNKIQKPYSLKISIGYAYAKRAADNGTLTLLRSADQALYENKRMHRIPS